MLFRSTFRDDLYYRLNVIPIHLPPLRERKIDIPLLIEHFLKKHGDNRSRPTRLSFAPEAVARLSSLPWWGNVRELEALVRRALALVEGALVDLRELERLIDPRAAGLPPEALPGAWPEPARPGAPRSFAEQERDVLVDALRQAGGNKARAARELGLHRNAFLRKLKKLGVTYNPR